MDLDRLMTRLNPVVAWLLRSPLHPLLSRGLLLLRVNGRRTGRRYWIPVGYQRDGDAITVLVSRARRKQWWRNYREPGPVEVLLRGRTLHGWARVVPPESAMFRAAVDTTFRRLPGLGAQFGIRYQRRTGLTGAQCRVVAMEGAVVSIDIGRAPAG
ncbi:MAG TPA: nitroreductase/quinone reductase family protein [Gemmatimonadales bacterium]|nr:nitroreductase/quinone reductase family protein [Gemmatimonadales bacterium]